jgi:hypothetical protein
MNEEERHLAIGTQFGLIIMLASAPWFLWLPMTTLPLVWSFCGPLGAAAAFCPMILPPLLSRTVHKHIHRPYGQGKDGGAVVEWLLASRYGRMMIRHHWLHHRYNDVNFNLLLGGDWILGVGRLPSNEDLSRMEADGIPLD